MVGLVVRLSVPVRSRLGITLAEEIDLGSLCTHSSESCIKFPPMLDYSSEIHSHEIRLRNSSIRPLMTSLTHTSVSIRLKTEENDNRLHSSQFDWFKLSVISSVLLDRHSRLHDDHLPSEDLMSGFYLAPSAPLTFSLSCISLHTSKAKNKSR